MPSASFDGWEIYVMLIPLSGDSEAQWNNEDLSHLKSHGSLNRPVDGFSAWKGSPPPPPHKGTRLHLLDNKKYDKSKCRLFLLLTDIIKILALLKYYYSVLRC
jgi:hypothetical protein